MPYAVEATVIFRGAIPLGGGGGGGGGRGAKCPLKSLKITVVA